jgi:hypothetical protein
MNIKRSFLLKYLAQAATEQIASEYQERGYEVTYGSKLSDLGADLIVKNDKETIVFEIKSGDWDAAKRQAVKRIRNRALHELGAKFKLVLVNVPEQPSIEIEGLESLFSDLLPAYCADELTRLAPHTWIDDISDTEIEVLSVQKDEMEVQGTAVVSFGLQYGSDGDFDREDRLRTAGSFPLHFHLLLDRDLHVKAVYSLELDIAEDEI